MNTYLTKVDHLSSPRELMSKKLYSQAPMLTPCTHETNETLTMTLVSKILTRKNSPKRMSFNHRSRSN